MTLPRLALLVISGCATASTDSGNPSDSGTPSPDARAIDAAPQPDALVMAALTQTSDSTVAADKSLACGNGTYTAENSWYRVFVPADHGITGPFKVTNVGFGVQESGGTQSVQIKIGTYSGAVGGTTLDTASMTPLDSATVPVPASANPQTLTTPITGTVPAGGKLVVEVFSPDHSGTSTFFYLGGSAGAETATSYLRAPVCSIPQPQAVKQINAGTGALIINVTGTH